MGSARRTSGWAVCQTHEVRVKSCLMPSVYKTELRVYLPSGESRGSVVVRISEEESRELDASRRNRFSFALISSKIGTPRLCSTNGGPVRSSRPPLGLPQLYQGKPEIKVLSG
jgi:hypothetical protein